MPALEIVILISGGVIADETVEPGTADIEETGLPHSRQAAYLFEESREYRDDPVGRGPIASDFAKASCLPQLAPLEVSAYDAAGKIESMEQHRGVCSGAARI
jgi:hypothetical protein